MSERKFPAYGALRAIVDLNRNLAVFPVTWRDTASSTGFPSTMLYGIDISFTEDTLKNVGLMIPTQIWTNYNTLQLEKVLVGNINNKLPLTEEVSSLIIADFLDKQRDAVRDNKHFFEWKLDLSKYDTILKRHDTDKYAIFTFTALK